METSREEPEICAQCWYDIVVCVSESLPGIGCAHDSARPGSYVETPFMLVFALCNNPAVLCWCMGHLGKLQRLCLQVTNCMKFVLSHGAMRMYLREHDHAPIFRSHATIIIEYFSSRRFLSQVMYMPAAGPGWALAHPTTGQKLSAQQAMLCFPNSIWHVKGLVAHL